MYFMVAPFQRQLQEDRGLNLKQRHFSDPREFDYKRKTIQRARSRMLFRAASTFLQLHHGPPFGCDGAHSPAWRRSPATSEEVALANVLSTLNSGTDLRIRGFAGEKSEDTKVKVQGEQYRW